MKESLSPVRLLLKPIFLISAIALQPLFVQAQEYVDYFNKFDSTAWTKVDKGEVRNADGVLSMKDCNVHAGDVNWTNYNMEFKARAPLSASEVRIFTSIRYNSDQSRYIFGLRGGNNNDLYLARIGAENNCAILNVEPLDFIPEKGVWYKIRIEADDNSFQVFLNDETEPRLKAVDTGAYFKNGKIGLGGGWSAVEFDYVKVTPLQGYKPTASAIKYNFQKSTDPIADGWIAVDNSRYSKAKGYGWREEELFVRERGTSDDKFYDTLVGFNKPGSKIFLQNLPDGDYVVTVHMGDPKHPSTNRIFFMDELQPAVNSKTIPMQKALIRKSITTYNGQLRMRFEQEKKGPGVSINWIAIDKRSDAGEGAWNKYLKKTDGGNKDEKEKLRKEQRSNYVKALIRDLEGSRTVYSLNGDWLFVPDYEVKKSKNKPWSAEADDNKWHVIDVPNFWSPTYNWTYNSNDMGRGSKNWMEMEIARCSAYTFNYNKTKVGYYKHYIDLPEDIAGRVIKINFESIAKSSQIWINGELVAVHQGMFAPIEVDITKHVKPGENTVVVQAGDSANFESDSDEIQGVAVSVEVTEKMLNSIPHGMFFGDNRGIWQGVSLIVSDPLTIEDSFFKPQTNHFDLDVELKNRGDSEIKYSLAAQLRQHKSNKLVYDHLTLSRKFDLSAAGGSDHELKLESEDAKHAPFKMWSPEFPNLYTMDIFAYNYSELGGVDLNAFAESAVKLNFQDLTDPKARGWTAVDGSVYGEGKSFGWSEKVEAYDRNINRDQIADTLVLMNPDSENVFTYDIENGSYVITIQFGDPEKPSLAEAYVGSGVNAIEDVIVRDFKNTGESVTVLKSVEVSNGKLEITIPSLPAEGEGTSVNWLVIEKKSDVSDEKWALAQNHFNILDNISYNAGFRTFAIEGEEFLLNGHPYKIRGANHNPNIIRPNDKKLANWFMKKIHDENINFTRSHGSPMNDIWLDAADEHGVAISQEGIWPWLFLHGTSVPHPSLITIWKQEWLALIDKHKNHPSLLMWTMNNEMKLFISNNLEPWEVLSDTIKDVRKLDPTRIVVADSGYCRKYLKNKKESLPDHIDDGDVDDVHYYPNWYNNETFFVIRGGESFISKRTPGRPYISQEFSTGYPDADTGHAIKHYIYTHMTPQALVGKWGYEHNNPEYFLRRHALTSKESCEAIRTGYRDTSAGIMIFALCTWFQNLYDVEKIKPYPTLDGVSMAWEPVMVSAQLMGRHFYAGTSHTVNSVVVNDSPTRETLENINVEWAITHNGKALSSGTKGYSGSLEYYKNLNEPFKFNLPEKLSASKLDAQLVLKLYANGKHQSTNVYDVVVCDESFTSNAKGTKVAYYSQGNGLSGVLEKLAVNTVKIDSLNNLSSSDYDVLMLDDLNAKPEGYEKVLEFASNGGRVILSNNREHVLALFPDELRGNETESKQITTPAAYSEDVFNGIEPDDLAWFTGTEESKDSLWPGLVPIACHNAYNVNYSDHVTLLVETTRIHGYYNGKKDGYHPFKTFDQVHGYPLLEIQKGKGSVIVSSMYLETPDDPIAHKLLANVISYMAKK